MKICAVHAYDVIVEPVGVGEGEHIVLWDGDAEPLHHDVELVAAQHGQVRIVHLLRDRDIVLAGPPEMEIIKNNNPKAGDIFLAGPPEMEITKNKTP